MNADAPRYTNPTRFNSASLPAVPPFGMKNVTCRAFPLKANIAVLNSFCDAYLNMDVPPEIAHFRPTLPYVYLMALDYGAMSPEAIEVQNLGWVAQHELLFMVPLQQWRREKGRMVFKNWACVSPFIFVDDAMSQRTGREVYGWPKVLGRIEAEVPMWARDPRRASNVFNMSVHVFPRTFAGEVQEQRLLVDIQRDSPPSLLTLPLDASNVWNPFNILSNAVESSVNLSIEALDMLLALRARGYRTNRSPRTLMEMSFELGRKVRDMLPDIPWTPNAEVAGTVKQGNVQQLGIEQVTLKQFQDAESPLDACYQAIITSTMAIDRLNAFGFLGDINLLRGDTSGGFTVRIHRYDAQPIIDTLGIEVANEEEADDGTRIAIIKPTLPFWTDVDLNYGKGKGLCSRIPKTLNVPKIVWRDGDLNPVENDNAAELDRIPFNTARGAATQTVAGPFHFPDATIQVYPLLADQKRLQHCVDEYVNAAAGPSGFEFKVLGSYAYLMVNVCGDRNGEMWSETNNIGSWAEREVSFCIPVKWYKVNCQCEGDQCVCRNGCKCTDAEKTEGSCKCRDLQSLAIIEPFVFENSGRAVLTSREINGRAAVKATIDSPADVWMDGTSGPNRSRRYMKLETEVFPALNLGQRSEQRTLIEIDADDVLGYMESIAWRKVAEDWGDKVVEELLRKVTIAEKHETELKKAKAMALEIFACGQPINWINVKQYRDTDDAEIACYQAIVHTTKRLKDVYDIREIESRVHVRLHRYPGQPIADTLGLKIKHTESRDGEVVQSLQPIRPFWMRVSYTADLGKVLCWRSSQEVTVTHPWFQETGVVSRSRTQAPPRGSYEHGYFSAPGYTRIPKCLGAHGPAEHADLTGSECPLNAQYRPGGDGNVVLDVQRIPTTVEAWMRRELLRELKDLFKSNHSDSEELQRLPKLESLEAFADSQSCEDLYQLVERVLGELGRKNVLRDFSSDRVERPDATVAIEAIDEVQVLIESLLSDEWGRWGEPLPRWRREIAAEAQAGEYQMQMKKNLEAAFTQEQRAAVQAREDLAEAIYPKPPFCIRADTIASDEQLSWIRRHADALTLFDGEWLYKKKPPCKHSTIECSNDSEGSKDDTQSDD